MSAFGKHRVASHQSPVTPLAFVVAVVLALASALALAQDRSYGGEDREWDVAPAKTLRPSAYHAPTPRQIPGGRVVRTVELKSLLEQEPRPYLIDVLGGGVHRTIAGAFWMAGAGAGDMSKEEESRFVETIAKFAGGDRNRALVFFCSDSECWLSYNAALRAINAGYTNIMWYRGGLAAWLHAELPMQSSDPFAW